MTANAPALAQHTPLPSTRKVAAAYAAMLLASVALFVFVRFFGKRLSAGVESLAANATASEIAKDGALFHLLFALAAIILLGRWLGKLFLHFSQPRVIGEMLAGIALGPSLLGQVWPAAMDFVLPEKVAGSLFVIAQLGVILYMFLIGLELNAGLLRSRAHATVAISHASIVTPFLLGTILALWLYPRLAVGHVSFTSFALFMGAAMSITAFPVLARILTDRNMDKSELGVVAIGCAATDDVTAWCLLAFVVGVANSAVGGAVQTSTIRPCLRRLHALCRPAARHSLSRNERRESSTAPHDRLGAHRPLDFRFHGRMDRHPCHLRRVSPRRRDSP